MTTPPQPNRIYRLALPVPLYRLFDYLIDDSTPLAQPGARIEVPFGKTVHVGVLIEIATESEVKLDKLKPILRVLDYPPLLAKIDLDLLHWVSRYYHHPLGEVMNLAFPKLLRSPALSTDYAEPHYQLTEVGFNLELSSLKRSRKQHAVIAFLQQHRHAVNVATLTCQTQATPALIKQLCAKEWLARVAPVEAQPLLSPQLLKSPILSANAEQQAAITAVSEQLGKFSVFLLEGVTGSGKTEVYMQIIQQALTQGLQVLVLVPEISLTPQLEQRFRQRFNVAIAVSHSKLTDKQRGLAWLSIQQGHSQILLGTRSALFTPLKWPGLIILDEEHDVSFKQQDGLRFSARDVAVMRAKLLNIPVVLGSATPSLESLHNAINRRYQHLHLPQRAGLAITPEMVLLDIRNKKVEQGLSQRLCEEINTTLAKREQVLLFINRRGYAPRLICHSCGWVARCKHCDANLVVHKREQTLRCHHCGSRYQPVNTCPVCNAQELVPLGLGTERIEQLLTQYFPNHKIARIDQDSVQRKGALTQYLQQIQQQHVDIILGTQLLAKGHHFENVTLVALLDVDSGLFSIDFHAAERLAQLIVQVSGRAGRAEKPGKVILQTRHPEHPLLTTLLSQGYAEFARMALAERATAQLPPYSYQALLRVEATEQDKAEQFLQRIIDSAQQCAVNDVSVLGPVPAPMPRRIGFYHYQLLLQSVNRTHLHFLINHLIKEINQIKTSKKLRWSLDIDPIDLF